MFDMSAFRLVDLSKVPRQSIYRKALFELFISTGVPTACLYSLVEYEVNMKLKGPGLQSNLLDKGKI